MEWNTFKTFDDILKNLEAEIICFQEMKSSRQGLPKQVSLPPSFDSFFSFPTRKTGYSGVAVYTRRDAVVPVKAEEGLSGLLQPRPRLSMTERVSEEYPSFEHKELDEEGRALVIDFGLFVLINTYCPNNTGTEEREKFKMEYHRLLEDRVACLIKEGREVMVVGDLNACAAVQDHCEGELMVARGLAEGLQGEEGFWGVEYRRRMKDWLVGGGGCMVDIVRQFWPDRQEMYTCWNTKIGARASNYGTRIDFVLLTPKLVPWVKAADIQPQVKGSDHCPVFIDLHDEITQSDGTIVKLSDVLGLAVGEGKVPDPPRIAAKFWDEHKQNLLSSFFGKSSKSESPSTTQTPTLTVSANASVHAVANPSAGSSSQSASKSAPPASQPARTDLKRKLVVDSNDKITKKPNLAPLKQEKSKSSKAKQPSQSTLAGFLAKPKALPSKSPPVPVDVDTGIGNEVDEDADYRLALLLSQSDDNTLPSSSQGSTSSTRTKKADDETKNVWSNLLAPTPVPMCTGHDEPAKEFTVNKPGPNKGKKFFICSRPVGPGYDKGRSERLREQVDPQWRCDFFKWSSDARKERARKPGL
ncbi:hypothetical protein D9619_013429 [Psilocybe cf. subviscida]|uniref:DNA-(apurinic or apyrimidinic site) endonuclease n=1 Tax=Psilocybe cf. subviscida TaxID=2480587 RepID=A0A8H5BTF1_9AGAR|nr:hypothetical protein D9619_013429 [Psilocybe cf. subviscida]